MPVSRPDATGPLETVSGLWIKENVGSQKTEKRWTSDACKEYYFENLITSLQGKGNIGLAEDTSCIRAATEELDFGGSATRIALHRIERNQIAWNMHG